MIFKEIIHIPFKKPFYYFYSVHFEDYAKSYHYLNQVYNEGDKRVETLLGMIHYAKVKDNLNYKNLLILFLIAISAYLSHIFSFLCFLMFISIGEGLSLVLNIKDKTKWQPKKIFFQLIKLASTFIVPIILTIFYFQKRPSDGKEIYLSKEELFSIILNGDIFKSFGGNEDFYSKPLIYLLFFVMLYAIISVFHFCIKMQEKKFSFSNVFFFFSIVLFYLFFTQPNADGYGGYINIRIALFAFLFIIIWSVIVIKTEFKFEITIFIVVLFLNYKLYQCKKDGITWLNEGQKKFESFEKIISEKSVIAPVFWAKDLYWLGGHFSNFIGAEKNCVVLENYEASTGYFPVLWKNNSMPLNKNGDFFSKEEAEKFLFELNNYRYGKVDYVLIYGDTKGIDANIFFTNKIIETFDFIRSDNNITLYRSKKF